MRWLIFLTPILIAAGCSRDHAAPAKAKAADTIRAVGLAKPAAPREHPAPTGEEASAAFAGQVFEAEASATGRDALTDPTERQTVARAQARRAALRVLAVKVLTRPVTPGSSLGDWVQRAGGWPERLSDILEKNAEVVYDEQGGAVTAKVRLAGEVIAQGLDFSELTKIEASDAAMPSSPQSRERVQAQATEDARQKLREALLEVDTGKGPLRSLIETEDGLKGRFDVLVGSAPPSSVNFSDDGSCQVIIEFNRERARTLVDR